MIERTPPVSVVVPTRNRPAALARCLGALERQTGCPAFEVVVVDDGSARGAEVADVVGASPRARLVRESGRGPAAARNAGGAAAVGSTLLFVDDDCEPEPRWAARLVEAIARGADVAAGRSVNPRADDALAEATQTILDYLTERALDADGTAAYVSTTNFACRAEVLMAVPFDPAFATGEDRDWSARLRRFGYRLVVEPAATVVHRQELTFGAFWWKHVTYGRGSRRYRQAHARSLERPLFYTGLVREGFRRGRRTGLAVCVAQVATAVGYAREAAAERSRQG